MTCRPPTSPPTARCSSAPRIRRCTSTAEDGSGRLNSFLARLPDGELLAFPDGFAEAGEFTDPIEMVFLDEIRNDFWLPVRP